MLLLLRCGYNGNMEERQDQFGELAVETIRGDRRAHRRYEVGLELRYKVLAPGGAERAGFGTAHNLSRGGVLLHSNEALPVGLQVEVSLQWPFRLQNVCPLDLVIVGQTVRVGAGATAVRTSSYSFRT